MTTSLTKGWMDSSVEVNELGVCVGRQCFIVKALTC